ncbi:MAG: Nif3-like dinuclear metal center hexameric protein [Acidimicrobiia bacterium]
MSTVAEVAVSLAERTRPGNAAAWDPVGLQLGDPEASVARVGVCHEVTQGVLTALEEKPVDLLITYHPLLFQPTNRLIAGRSAEARAWRLVRLGVSLLVTHTDFDASPGGTADALADLLDLREVESFGGDADEGIPDIGRVGVFGATLEALDAIISDSFGPAGLRITGDRHRQLHRVAVVPGAGGEFVEAAARVADALVTGDVSHHRCVRAADVGLAIVDPGHTATERPGMVRLVDLVRTAVDAEVVDLTAIDPKTWT